MNMQSFFQLQCKGWLDLHIVIICHQAGLQFLRVVILLQQVQGQLVAQAQLGQKHVLQRADKGAKNGERDSQYSSAQWKQRQSLQQAKMEGWNLKTFFVNTNRINLNPQ